MRSHPWIMCGAPIGNPITRRAVPFVLAAAIASLLATGCGREQTRPPAGVPEVAVIEIKPQPVVLESDLPGRTAGYLVAEIRPQVNGLIKKRLFTEGSRVKANELLYEIDPAPYQAALDNAKANVVASQKSADRARASLNASYAALKRSEATRALAQTNLKRFEKLLATHAISEMDRDQSKTDLDVAEASVLSADAQIASDREAVGVAEAAIKQAEAARETARINLGYTKITAPISGRIGRSTVTEGAIVTAYQILPMAVIQQFDPIYVDVPQSTMQVHNMRSRMAAGSLKSNSTKKVKIILEDGAAYPQEGSLAFRDVTVEPTTGSIILRIVVPNPEGILLPGMFVRAVIDEGVNEHGLLVPQQAVSRDPKGNPMALLVDGEGKVQARGLTTDRAIGDKWLVSSGLSPGDRVIVEGMQKARQGSPAKAVPFVTGAPPPRADSQTRAP